jgi:pilus assembly protein CpaB
MRTKSIVLLVLALGCGLVASIGISQIIEQNKNAPGAAETEAILVAMKPIAGQEQLKAENIKLEEWPKHLIPKGALTKLEEIEGRRIKHAMAPGEPILQNKLVGDQDKRPTLDVPPGFRLATVHADAVSAVGNLIQPEDRVDVLVYLRNFGGGAQHVGTSTILQDIKVFAVNDQWRPNEGNETENVATKNVTLLVTPEQAERLTLATELGKVRLVLRSPDDNLRTDIGAGTTAKDLFGLTDGENKAEELKFLASNAKDAPKGNGGLLGMLGGAHTGPASDTFAAVPDVEVFTMELLEGPRTRTIEFSRETGRKARWQPAETAANRGNGASAPGLSGGELDASGLPGGLVLPGAPAEKD